MRVRFSALDAMLLTAHIMHMCFWLQLLLTERASWRPVGVVRSLPNTIISRGLLLLIQFSGISKRNSVSIEVLCGMICRSHTALIAQRRRWTALSRTPSVVQVISVRLPSNCQQDPSPTKSLGSKNGNEQNATGRHSAPTLRCEESAGMTSSVA